MRALVPSCSGACSPWTEMRISALPSLMLRPSIVPAASPSIWTRPPRTSWRRRGRRSSSRSRRPRPRRSPARVTPPATATARGVGHDLGQCGNRQSIPSGPADSPERNWWTNGSSESNASSASSVVDELVPSTAGRRSRRPCGRWDVVGDHDVGPAVLGVHVEDQVVEQAGAHRVETGVGLVEQDDLRVEHQRPGEAGPLAHPAGDLVRHLRWAPSRPTSARRSMTISRSRPRASSCACAAGRRRCRRCSSSRTARRPGTAHRNSPALVALLVATSRQTPGRRPACRPVGLEQADDVLEQHALAGTRRAEHGGDGVVDEVDGRARRGTLLAVPKALWTSSTSIAAGATAVISLGRP